MPVSDAELVALVRSDPDRAWDTLVDQYSDLIFSVAAKFSWDEDGRVDLYLHICQKLQENGLRRLGKFELDKGGTSCKFSTWLVTVARNLCIDWIRGRDGRKRLNEPIKKLSETDQLIFRYCYWEGLSFAEAYETLKAKHGAGFEFGEVYSAARRINQALTAANLWSLAKDLMRMVPALSLDSGLRDDEAGDKGIELGADVPGQDEELAAREFESIFREIVGDLESKSKIILKSYYFQQLPVKEISAMIDLPEHTIYRELKRITKQLSERFREKSITAGSLPEGVRVRLESALS